MLNLETVVLLAEMLSILGSKVDNDKINFLFGLKFATLCGIKAK